LLIVRWHRSHSAATPALIGWLALALLAFGVLVLLPLAALLAGGVWLAAPAKHAQRLSPRWMTRSGV